MYTGSFDNERCESLVKFNTTLRKPTNTAVCNSDGDGTSGDNTVKINLKLCDSSVIMNLVSNT
jgi:hypothetical protein